MKQPARLDRFQMSVTTPDLDPKDQAGVLRTVRSCLIHATLLNEPEVDIVLNAPLRRTPLEGALAGSSLRPLATCNQVRTRLSDYLDAEAGVEVEQHLRGCGRCLELANGLQGTVELCREYGPSVKPRRSPTDQG